MLDLINSQCSCTQMLMIFVQLFGNLFVRQLSLYLPESMRKEKTLHRMRYAEFNTRFFVEAVEKTQGFAMVAQRILLPQNYLNPQTYQKIIKQQSFTSLIVFKKMNKFQKTKFSDLEIIENLAQTHGGNTKIYLCRYEKELQVCKALLKSSIINDGKAIEHVKNQKQALKYFTDIKCGYVCQLFGTFQDENYLYIMMEMAQGLPLHRLIQMMGPFNDRITKIVCSQIGQIMRRFHSEGYIYRDIKCSNFMIDVKGRVKMIDLGKSKLIKRERAYTICGTTHAMPPEVYKKQGYSYEFDYYSFGVLIYELLAGSSPFGYGGSNKKIIEDVENGLTPEILQKLKNLQARELVSKLMDKDPNARLGRDGGFSQILKHPFFKSDLEYSLSILNGKDELSPFEQEFSELVSEIEDLGIYPQKYNQITEDDPFYKFL